MQVRARNIAHVLRAANGIATKGGFGRMNGSYMETPTA
jgi:hypothetical protein